MYSVRANGYEENAGSPLTGTCLAPSTTSKFGVHNAPHRVCGWASLGSLQHSLTLYLDLGEGEAIG